MKTKSFMDVLKYSTKGGHQEYEDVVFSIDTSDIDWVCEDRVLVATNGYMLAMCPDYDMHEEGPYVVNDRGMFKMDTMNDAVGKIKSLLRDVRPGEFTSVYLGGHVGKTASRNLWKKRFVAVIDTENGDLVGYMRSDYVTDNVMLNPELLWVVAQAGDRAEMSVSDCGSIVFWSSGMYTFAIMTVKKNSR